MRCHTRGCSRGLVVTHLEGVIGLPIWNAYEPVSDTARKPPSRSWWTPKRTAVAGVTALVVAAPLLLGHGVEAAFLNLVCLGICALLVWRFTRRLRRWVLTRRSAPQPPQSQGSLLRGDPFSLPAIRLTPSHNDNYTTHTDSPDHRDVEPRGTVSYKGPSRFFISGGSDMTTATMTTGTAGRESELRTAARRHGLTIKDLAALMDVSAGYLSQIATGRRPWTQTMREKAMAVLGEVPGQGTVYRQREVVTTESSFIRERAREMGMTMQDLAERVGISYGYLLQVSRGHRNMSAGVQARVESVLRTQVKVAASTVRQPQGERGRQRKQLHQGACSRPRHDHAGPRRESRHLIRLPLTGVTGTQEHGSQGAGKGRGCPRGSGGGCTRPVRRGGQAGHVGADERPRHQPERGGQEGRYQLRSSLADHDRSAQPVAGVLKRLHGVLFQRTQAERVMPAEVKVLGWRKGERSGMVVRGAGGPGRGDGGGAVRTGGRMPWGAEVWTLRSERGTTVGAGCQWSTW